MPSPSESLLWSSAECCLSSSSNLLVLNSHVSWAEQMLTIRSLSQPTAEPSAHARPGLVKLQQELNWPEWSCRQAQSHHSNISLQMSAGWLHKTPTLTTELCFPELSSALHPWSLHHDLVQARPRTCKPSMILRTLMSYTAHFPSSLHCQSGP